MSQSQRFLGITVLSPFFQNEGIDAVLDNVVDRAGATAVAVNTSVTAPSEEGVGSFQPPSDADTSPRLFDRPIWGRSSGWLRSGPAHAADPALFRDSPYPPREPNDLTDRLAADDALSGLLTPETIRTLMTSGGHTGDAADRARQVARLILENLNS